MEIIAHTVTLFRFDRHEMRLNYNGTYIEYRVINIEVFVEIANK